MFCESPLYGFTFSQYHANIRHGGSPWHRVEGFGASLQNWGSRGWQRHVASHLEKEGALHKPPLDALQPRVDGVHNVPPFICCVIGDCEITQCGFKARMPKPLLNLPCLRALGFTVGCKILTKLVQNPFFANRSIGAGHSLPVFLTDTLAAVQPTIKSRPFQAQ